MSLNLPILMYHKISAPLAGASIKGLHVSPELFDRQLNLLCKEGYTFCDFEDLNKALKGEPVPAKPIIITFDDGHLDNYTNGLPILKKYEAKAVVFVIAGDMGKKDLVWPDAGETMATDIMSWEQAKEMSRYGISIESHGLNHRKHSRLSPHEIKDELIASYRMIEKNIGKAPLAFAYPYGDINPEAINTFKFTDYLFACTTEEGVNSLEELERGSLKRIAVRGYKWMHWIKFKGQVKRGFE